MKIDQVRYIGVVKDMERAVSFYRDVVALRVKYRYDQWTELVFGNAVIALHGGDTGEHSEIGLSFQVGDIESAYAEVSAGGGRVVNGPTDRSGERIKLANLCDTEGNGFTISQSTG